LACKKGYLEVVNRLVQSGVDLNAKDNYGDTPLNHACENGYLEVID
jgi:ankyrin repeat protein